MTQKKYELVASSNGYRYSMKLREEKIWRHTEHVKPSEYEPFKGYIPVHKKNLRLGCKLLIKDHWPGFVVRAKNWNIEGQYSKNKNH